MHISANHYCLSSAIYWHKIQNVSTSTPFVFRSSKEFIVLNKPKSLAYYFEIVLEDVAVISLGHTSNMYKL